MLNLLRINAETHLLHWCSLENYIPDDCSYVDKDGGSTEPSDTEHGKSSTGIKINEENTKNKTLSYLRSSCQMVRARSSETAVTFLYLPEPPRIKNSTKEENINKAETYLTNLEVLTNHWPPTLLVRGVSPVTSTTL